MKTYIIKSKPHSVIKDTSAYVVYQPLEPKPGEWRSFVIEVKRSRGKCQFPLSWNGSRLAENDALTQLRVTDPNAEHWAIDFFLSLSGLAASCHDGNNSDDSEQHPILWAQAKKAFLTDAEIDCHAFLHEKLQIGRYKLLWHVPLSQILHRVSVPENSFFRSTATLAVLDKEYEALVVALGVDASFDPETLACLRKCVPIVHVIDWSATTPCQRLLTLVTTSAGRANAKLVINEPEFRTKQAFEDFLKAHMLNPYFDNSRSRLETAGTAITLPRDVAAAASAFRFSDFVVELGLKNGTRGILDRVSSWRSQQVEMLNKYRNPLRGYYFLHEFLLAAMIERPPGIVTDYGSLTDAMHERLKGLAQSKIAGVYDEPFHRWSKNQSPDFVRRRVNLEKRRIFQDSQHQNTKKLGEHLAKSPVDIMVLNSAALPVLAIEFDGQTHDKLEQKEKDHLKDQALSQLGIPLIRISSIYPIRLTQSDQSRKDFKYIKRRVQETEQFVSYIFDFLVARKLRKERTVQYKEWVKENIQALTDEEIDRRSDNSRYEKLDKELVEAMEKISQKSGKTLKEADDAFLALDRWQQEASVESLAQGYDELEAHAEDDSLIEEVAERNERKLDLLKELFGDGAVAVEIKATNDPWKNFASGRITIMHLKYDYRVPFVGGTWLDFIPSRVRSQFIANFLVARLLEQGLEWADQFGKRAGPHGKAD